jgi:hypothetical protein
MMNIGDICLIRYLCCDTHTHTHTHTHTNSTQALCRVIVGIYACLTCSILLIKHPVLRNELMSFMKFGLANNNHNNTNYSVYSNNLIRQFTTTSYNHSECMRLHNIDSGCKTATTATATDEGQIYMLHLQKLWSKKT